MAQTQTQTQTQTHSATEFGSDTKKKVINPRAEIDTSPPFGSVEEAVTHFGGRGSWIPHHFFRLPPDHDGVEDFDIEKVEEQAAELEKNLIVKERETLDVLKKLEAAKRIVEVLKQKLVKEGYECITTPDDSQGSTPDEKSAVSVSLYPAPSSGLILMELNEAKLNLDKTTNDLAAIRACVESLNKKVIKEKIMSEKNENRQKPNSAGVLSVEEKLNRERVKLQTASDDAEPRGGPWNSTKVSRELQQFNFGADQFKNMAEAARYEVMKAMLEIEQTKTSITMVEMRLIAAKKMEEAARAVEAVAVAEMKVRPNSESSFGGFLQRPEGITLSYEEYYTLTQEAQKAYELSKNRAVDTTRHIDEAHVSNVASPQKLEETTKEVTLGKKSLGEALGNIEGGNRRKLVDEEACFRGRSEGGNRRKLFDEGAFFRGRSEHNKMRHSGHNPTNLKFKNSYPSYSQRDSQLLDGNESNVPKDKSMPCLRSTISIGDILSRKLILQDDFMVGKHVEGDTERETVSLNQMLREQSGLIFSSTKAVKDESVHKQFFALRKKFGFIHVSFPLAKQSKKKA